MGVLVFHPFGLISMTRFYLQGRNEQGIRYCFRKPSQARMEAVKKPVSGGHVVGGLGLS